MPIFNIEGIILDGNRIVKFEFSFLINYVNFDLDSPFNIQVKQQITIFSFHCIFKVLLSATPLEKLLRTNMIPKIRKLPKNFAKFYNKISWSKIYYLRLVIEDNISKFQLSNSTAAHRTAINQT